MSTRETLPYREPPGNRRIKVMTTTQSLTQEVLQVSNLNKTYKTGKSSLKAVDNLNFHVDRGEVYGLLGTNGAGKTTTLEIIEGLSRASSGTVAVFGKDPIIHRSEVRPLMGIMLQSGGLPSQLTVKETLSMWQGTCSTPLDSAEVMEKVGLGHRQAVRVGVLSGGEQRRLDLACALVSNPALLFLDEPTTGLDPESRRNVWKLLLDLKAQGTSMVLTTHYLEEAEMLCDRIAIMDRGVIAAEGTVDELVARVDSKIEFVADNAPRLERTTLVSNGDKHVIATDDLPGDTLKVLTWARDNGIALRNFSARPATLEKVFLSIADHEIA